MLKKLVFALFALVIAGAALAATLAEVTADANALLTEYEDLESRVDNCPGGTCPEAQDILDDLDVAEADRTQLHADRDTLDPCSSCGSVDATISDIDDLSAELAAGTGDWNETAS
jgi:hypothetical protein